MKAAGRAAAECTRLGRWKEIGAAVRQGVRAVTTRHRGLIANPRAYACSVDLDRALRAAEPNATRWDYVLVAPRGGVGMEVHPAKLSEVDRIVAKKRWAEERLVGRCQIRVSRWWWVRPPGSPLQFTPVSPRARSLAMNGIHFPVARLPAPAAPRLA